MGDNRDCHAAQNHIASCCCCCCYEIPWKQANPHATPETEPEAEPEWTQTGTQTLRPKAGASQATSITCNFPAFAAINFTGAQQQQQHELEQPRAEKPTQALAQKTENRKQKPKLKPTRCDTIQPHSHI